MTTFLANVRRRWRNITNAARGIDEYVDENGNRYVGDEIDEYLDRKGPSA